MIFAAYGLAFIIILLAISLVMHLRAPWGFAIWKIKLYAGAVAAYMVWVSGIAALLSMLVGNNLAGIICFLAMLIFASYVRRVSAPAPRLENGFGEDWWKRIPPELGRNMLARRWDWKMRIPTAFKPPRVEEGVTFWSQAGEDGSGELLCDIWTPAEGVKRLGIGIVYFHGGGWFNSRREEQSNLDLFNYLAGQGYVIMDADYRTAPEVDIFGMLGDVKRGVAWFKDAATRYEVDPARVVVMGAAAGGQLSLVHAFAPDHPELTPADLRGKDLSVRAVVSFYGPCDLAACYAYTNQDQVKDAPREGQETPGFGKMSVWMGGSPEEAARAYELVSAANHVHENCPPTMLIQGEHDLVTPVEKTRALGRSLREVGVPVVNVVLPFSDHGFDRILPSISAPAQTALFYLERFLAIVG